MKHLLSVGATALALALSSSPAAAQHVSADIRINEPPIAGRIIVAGPRHAYEDRDGYYRRPVRRVVVREEPRVIIVERYHVPRGNAYGYWRHHGFRPFMMWYDARYDRYYEREDAGSGLREVTVYEHDGRYYRDENDGDRYDGYHRHDREQRHERHDRDDHRGHDDHHDRDD